MFRQFTNKALSTAVIRTNNGLIRPVTALTTTVSRSMATISTNTNNTNPTNSSNTNTTADDELFTSPLTEEERNQQDWADWDRAKVNFFILGTIGFCTLLVRYWYNKETSHYSHRWVQPPYPYFINRDSAVGAGWWPGRRCQFFEFNCFSAAYEEAENALAAKSGKPAGNHGHH